MGQIISPTGASVKDSAIIARVSTIVLYVIRVSPTHLPLLQYRKEDYQKPLNLGTPLHQLMMSTTSLYSCRQHLSSPQKVETAAPSIKTNVLFDLGSQQSYVSTKLTSTLSLQSVAEKSLQISVFGSKQTTTKVLQSVNLNLRSVNQDDIPVYLPLQALVVDHIANPLKSVPEATIRQFKHCKNLKLADEFTEGWSGSIVVDVLIGADQ